MRNFNSSFNHIIQYIANIPYLYRYENQNYIDDFFENGNLYISSFQNYIKYDDNELGDTTEGSAWNTANLSNDKQITILSTSGSNDYTFCTSTIFDEKLMGKFSRNSVFRIKDPINFILEITRSLNRVHNVLHGNCIYVDDRIITKNYLDLDSSIVENSDGQVMLDKVFQLNNEIQGIDSYFLKKRKYPQQAEYRIIWQTDREVNGGIIINCPEAIKFCEKIESNQF